MMLSSLFWIIGCSSDPHTFFTRKHSCRIVSFSSEESSNGVNEIEEREYRWSEGRVDYQGLLSEGYTLYNEYGFFIESHQLYYDEGENFHQQEYDCTEEWCWRTKRIAEYEREGRNSSATVRYVWDGKTEHFIQEDGGTGYTIHNDYARAIEWYYENELGYQEEFYTYDCSSEYRWCKLLSLEGRGVYDPPALTSSPSSLRDVRDILIDVFNDTSETTELYQTYIWTGNRQDWSNDYGEGYTTYNTYGYPIERFLRYESWEKWEYYEWDCGE